MVLDVEHLAQRLDALANLHVMVARRVEVVGRIHIGDRIPDMDTHHLCIVAATHRIDKHRVAAVSNTTQRSLFGRFDILLLAVHAKVRRPRADVAEAHGPVHLRHA